MKKLLEFSGDIDLEVFRSDHIGKNFYDSTLIVININKYCTMIKTECAFRK